MAKKELTPQEKDQLATEKASMLSSTEEVKEASANSTWLWIAVGIIVLVGIVGGVIVGFLGGRFYNLLGPDDHTAEDLLGATLTQGDGAVFFDEMYVNGPAPSAGIMSGDELLAIDAESVRSVRAAYREIARHQIGDVVLLTVRRNFRTLQFEVRLGIIVVTPIIEPPPATPFPPTVLPPSSSQLQSAGRLGVQYRMLQPGDSFDVDEGALIIVFLADNTPAEQAGLRSGDIIVRVNRQAIGSGLSLTDALVVFGEGERVTITFIRDGQEDSVRVALGGS